MKGAHRRREYEDYVKARKGRIHSFHPSLFNTFAQIKELGIDVSLAVKKMLPLIAVRRGMLTKIRLPDGTHEWLGQGMKDLKVTTVELATSSDSLRLIQQHITRIEGNLFTQGEPGAAEVVGGVSHRAAPIQMNVGSSPACSGLHTPCQHQSYHPCHPLCWHAPKSGRGSGFCPRTYGCLRHRCCC